MSEKAFLDVSKDLATDFGALRQDVAKLTAMVGDLAVSHAGSAQSGIMTAVSRVREEFDDLPETFDASTAIVSKRVRGASEDLEGLVKRNPLTALFLAMLGGVIVGMLSRSR